MRIAAKIFLLIFSLLQSAQGGRYYLSTTGSDGQVGSIHAPWATFAYAMTRLRPGDSLLVREGVYREGEIWIRKAAGMGGADGRFVTLMAYPGELVQLDGSRRIIVDADFMRIQGFTFCNTYSLDFPSWESPGLSTNAEILDNHFVGNFLLPIEFCGRNSLIEGNTIDSRDGSSHAIYLHYGRNNIIRRNRIIGTYKYGIHMYDEHKNEDPAGFVREYHNIILEDNFITGCRTRAGIVVGTSADSPTPGVIMDSVVIRKNIITENATEGILVKAWSGRISHVDIYNNTIYQNGEAGIKIDDAHEIRIFNNIIISSSAPHIDVDARSGKVTAQRNLYGPGSRRLKGVEDDMPLEADPLFDSTSGTGFSLLPGSPARDTGLPNNLEYSGSAPDLGAREASPTSGKPGEEPSETGWLRFMPCYPNPLNGRTVIIGHLFKPFDIRVGIYDSLGRQITLLKEGPAPAGKLKLEWDGHTSSGMPAPSGVYFCCIQFGGSMVTRKIALVH